MILGCYGYNLYLEQNLCQENITLCLDLSVLIIQIFSIVRKLAE